MDLQTILSHRTNCIICGALMCCYSPDHPNLMLHVSETGLRIDQTKCGIDMHYGIEMHFGFDGKYTRNKRNYKFYQEPQEPISVIRSCNDCDRSGKSLKDVTATRLNNMKTKRCAYRFQIMCDDDGNYDGAMNYEVVRYHDNQSFWHVDTSFVIGNSNLHYGKFSGKIDDILSLRIPAVVNLNSIQNINQFLLKFKTYMLMS